MAACTTRKMGRRRGRPQQVWGEGGVEESLRRKEKNERLPWTCLSTIQCPNNMGSPCDTYLIQYHTNIQLNTYKPILCNITQILYTRGHLTYSVMSPYTIRDISCYVVCKMTDRLILLCNMLRCTVLHSTRPHPQKSLTKKIHLSCFTNPNLEARMKYNLFSMFSQIRIFFQKKWLGPRNLLPTSQAEETFVFINHSKE